MDNVYIIDRVICIGSVSQSFLILVYGVERETLLKDWIYRIINRMCQKITDTSQSYTYIIFLNQNISVNGPWILLQGKHCSNYLFELKL